MTRATVAERRVFQSWQDIQDALLRAIAPLTDEQLNQRLVPGLRSAGEIAEHIAFGRALWLGRALGEDRAELAPMLSWDDANDPPRTAAEIVNGLELTWQVFTTTLMRGSATDEISDREVEILQTLWAMIDHDLPHAGELSLLLGAYSLPGVEL